MQSAKIISFPGAAPDAPVHWPDAQPRTVQRHGETCVIPAHPMLRTGAIVGVHYIALQLAMPDAEPGRLIPLIRKLVAAHRLPAPQPRVKGDQLLEGADAVCLSSRWRREDVDRHFTAGPPDPAASGAHPARHPARDSQLQQRLASMGGA